MNEITKEQALNRLRAMVNHNRSITGLAVQFGVPRSVMAAVLRGHTIPSKAMLSEIGVECRITYFSIDDQ